MFRSGVAGRIRFDSADRTDRGMSRSGRRTIAAPTTMRARIDRVAAKRLPRNRIRLARIRTTRIRSAHAGRRPRPTPRGDAARIRKPPATACYDVAMTASATTAPAPTLPGFADVLAAAARIAPHARRTPVLRSRSLDALAGCELHFKCENLQRIGAFKFRGACNAIFALPAEVAARGILTQSSGNHGAAVALAARLRGVPATVVVPEGAPAVKLAGIAAHGARIVRCAPGMTARVAAAAALQAESGAHLVHPFDDADVIAGQGTAALELLREAGELDALVTPVGGGGLLSGCALTARALHPAIVVLGAEPAGAADAEASLRAGHCITDMPARTVCDGLRGHLAPRTLALLQRHTDGILLVDDADTLAAMRLLWERLKLVVEPSAAVAFAAILRAPERFAGRRVGVVLSGGNVDLDVLPWQTPA